MSDTQLALTWDTGRARHDDPATSVTAGATVDVRGRCAELLPYLRRCDRPVTAWQLSLAMLTDGWKWAEERNVSRRLTDLERKALAVKVGEVVGRFGKSVTTWTAS